MKQIILRGAAFFCKSKYQMYALSNLNIFPDVITQMNGELCYVYRIDKSLVNALNNINKEREYVLQSNVPEPVR